jgi:hypothetical protein
MKAYRFFSDPGHIVSDGNTGLPMLKFDENGEYVTLDTVLAQRMGPHFRHEEIELVEVKEQAQVKEKAEEAKKEPDSLVCPVCDFKAASPSGLANHMRIKHKEV